MPLNVSDIVDTIPFGKDKESKEMYKEVFKEIGNHFIKNADRFSEQIVDAHAGMKVEINIPISDIVSFSVTFDEYIVKTKGD